MPSTEPTISSSPALATSAGVRPGRFQLGTVPGCHHPAAQGRGPLGGAVPQRPLVAPRRLPLGAGFGAGCFGGRKAMGFERGI